jgi:hypothetical protein
MGSLSQFPLRLVKASWFSSVSPCILAFPIVTKLLHTTAGFGSAIRNRQADFPCSYTLSRGPVSSLSIVTKRRPRMVARKVSRNWDYPRTVPISSFPREFFFDKNTALPETDAYFYGSRSWRATETSHLRHLATTLGQSPSCFDERQSAEYRLSVTEKPNSKRHQLCTGCTLNQNGSVSCSVRLAYGQSHLKYEAFSGPATKIPSETFS